MTPKANRSGVIRLSASQLQNPDLLSGLEAWLQLGLLSQNQVEQFCQDYLTCAVPLPVPISGDKSLDQAGSSSQNVPPHPTPTAAAAPHFTTDFADATEASKHRSSDRPPVHSADSPFSLPTQWLTRTLQSLMAEIGVIWLLGLGVFMVVVSSGVLAASQWRNFSAVGQYGILLAYTLAFWGVSIWTDRQPALQLTTRMLQTATLLIIPVNFWMMDGLNLWQTGAGVGLNLLAASILTAVLVKLTPQLSVTESRHLTLLNSLGLSWLHWGWTITGIPLVATYIGTIGTALLTYFRVRRSQATDPDGPANLSLSTLIITLATLLLLGRAILAAQVPMNQLGLAFGICGWLFCWLTRRETQAPFANLWTTVGASLLGVGWAITVAANPPWQALAISGLGLWLLGDRLRRQGTNIQLFTLLLLGLQTYILLWRILPIEWRQSLIATATQLMGTEGMPVVLLGLAGFPYLWLMLGIANRLRRGEQTRLAQLAELMALSLGTGMATISTFNPLVRSINLTLSAATLSVTLQHRTLAAAWVYLNHGLILVAIASWLDGSFPGLNELGWARISLVGMAIEWGLSLGADRLWRRGCWHFGLGLAGLSYGLLFVGFHTASDFGNQTLIWLAAPALLTGLSRLPRFHFAHQAAGLSAIGLIGELFLLNSVEGWMISLAIATGLMAINTLTLQHFVAALLTIGFGLGFEATAVHYYWPDLSFDLVSLLLAGNLWLLWLSEDLLMRRGQTSQLYGAAAHFWAVVISLISLISLSLHSFLIYTFEPGISTWTLSANRGISSGLIMLAIAYRLWRRGSTGLDFWGGFYGLAWATELFAITLLGTKIHSLDAVAIVTMALGLSSQIAGDLWVNHSGHPYRSSWHLIPLLYAGAAVILGHHTSTATTGLYTLATALVGIGIGRRTAPFKPLTLGALLLASIAAYELLIYQLTQASGAPGDGITLLAGLATGIAVGIRLGQGWLQPYLRLAQEELVSVAHLHWGLGVGLACFALSFNLSDRGFLLWLGFTVILTGYALAHGRLAVADPFPSSRWTYLGILAAWGVIGSLLYRIVPTQILLTRTTMLAAILAVFMYFLPWQAWGWPGKPWRNLAMVLPGITIVLTAAEISLQSLLIGAAFYAWIAKSERRLRLSYFSLFLFDWAAWRFLEFRDWLNLPWLGGLLALSLLYVAQLDPALQETSAREQRHWLRCLAVGLLSLTLFYQAEIEGEPTALLIRLLTLGLAIGLIFLGLMLRVRAFLYIGTVIFILTVLRVLWLFINNYSLLLWAIGIVVGLLFIWLAATFEARRSQMNALVQYWLTELANWE